MGMTFSVGSGVADSVFGLCQEPVRMFLESQGELYEQSSPLKKLFLMDTDDHAMVALTGMTAFSGFQPVGEGGEYPRDETRQGYKKVIEHMTWKDGFVITREAVEDGKLMDLKNRPNGFIKGYHRTREEFGARMYAEAINGKDKMVVGGKTFDLTCADGKKLFAKDHPSILGKGNQSNIFADKFSASTLGKLETRMQNFVGDNGNLLDVAPTTIVIPNDAAAKEAVFAAIGADKDPATSNNAFNYQFGRWNVVCWAYLNRFLKSYTDFPWLLIDERYNQDVGGAVWFDRIPLAVRSELAHNDDNEWLGRSRWGAGFNDWRFAAAGGISGGDSL